MKQKDAIKKIFPNDDDTTFGEMFIRSLYKRGYEIISSEEQKTLNRAVLKKWMSKVIEKKLEE